MHPLPSITGPGPCGAEDVVSLDAVVLKDGQRTALAPAATLRCPMAEAVAHWVREDVAPAAAATFGSPARTIVAGVSYECRGRDRIPGAKLSEHAHANALDLRGLKLTTGKVIDFTDSTVSKAFRETMRQSACASFTTVLGPGSDSYHADNIHLDLLERKGGYRICQWDVQPAPQTPSAPAPPERAGTVNSTK
ncbi:MAG: extensin family protein [Alphaproteobacteria bacterium]|nr:extensin family protein [Alphaproteobacteria bacterium]MBV9967136.1 extensin family protein [Alphaproteobacteria bacterium]